MKPSPQSLCTLIVAKQPSLLATSTFTETDRHFKAYKHEEACAILQS